MNARLNFLQILILSFGMDLSAQDMQPLIAGSKIQALKDTLENMYGQSDNAFFKIHCSSLLSVIASRPDPTPLEVGFLEDLYDAFNKTGDAASPKILSTYTDRKRPFILAWTSPTDGAVSLSWLKPPRNWDPTVKYPLYVMLHGLWEVASGSIRYMTYPFTQGPSFDKSFEDGYLLSPWGRGNYWYQGISETDIWECMAALEKIAKIDTSRKYIAGHSMGGYGAMSISSKSPWTWAAVGIYAGALQYNPGLANPDVANALRDIPIYFVCGINDGLLPVNEKAYQLINNTGNPNTMFVTFNGGHEYLEGNVMTMYMWMRNFVKEDISTGTDNPQNTNASGLSIESFTNPVNSTLTIKFSGFHRNLFQELFDLSGRLIHREKGISDPCGNEISFDSAFLEPGVYFLRLTSDDAISETKIMVKN